MTIQISMAKFLLMLLFCWRETFHSSANEFTFLFGHVCTWMRIFRPEDKRHVILFLRHYLSRQHSDRVSLTGLNRPSRQDWVSPRDLSLPAQSWDYKHLLTITHTCCFTRLWRTDFKSFYKYLINRIFSPASQIFLFKPKYSTCCNCQDSHT